jgi:hypothetical protein
MGELEIDGVNGTVRVGTWEVHLTPTSRACCIYWPPPAEWSRARRSSVRYGGRLCGREQHREPPREESRGEAAERLASSRVSLVPSPAAIGSYLARMPQAVADKETTTFTRRGWLSGRPLVMELHDTRPRLVDHGVKVSTGLRSAGGCHRTDCRHDRHLSKAFPKKLPKKRARRTHAFSVGAKTRREAALQEIEHQASIGKRT